MVAEKRMHSVAIVSMSTPKTLDVGTSAAAKQDRWSSVATGRSVQAPELGEAVMKGAPAAQSWGALIDRFDKFVSMPVFWVLGLTWTVRRLQLFARRSETN